MSAPQVATEAMMVMLQGSAEWAAASAVAAATEEVMEVAMVELAATAAAWCSCSR